MRKIFAWCIRFAPLIRHLIVRKIVRKIGFKNRYQIQIVSRDWCSGVISIVVVNVYEVATARATDLNFAKFDQFLDKTLLVQQYVIFSSSFVTNDVIVDHYDRLLWEFNSMQIIVGLSNPDKRVRVKWPNNTAIDYDASDIFTMIKIR